MAANFQKAHVKKPTTGFQPKRGRIKAHIFGGIAEAVATAASRAFDFVGFVKNDNSAHVTPPGLMVAADPDSEDGKVNVDLVFLEKDP